jgi:hypothetical protein
MLIDMTVAPAPTVGRPRRNRRRTRVLNLRSTALSGRDCERGTSARLKGASSTGGAGPKQPRGQKPDRLRLGAPPQRQLELKHAGAREA